MIHTKQLKIISVTLLCLTILTVIVNNPSGFNSKSTMVNDDKSPILNTRKTITTILSSPSNTTFLPNTNLTVTKYINNYENSSSNASILSIDSSYWYVHCDYFNSFTKETFLFDSTVNRSSVDDFYPANNYYNWDNGSQSYFDYWINTSNFEPGYVVETAEGDLTVEESETITMKNLGDFEVWKLSGILLSIFVVTARYEVSTGMCVYTHIQVISDEWEYNLTRAELGQIQPGYSGPNLAYITPNNNTVHPNGTTIKLGFGSIYGIHTIYYQWDETTNYSTYLSSIETLIPQENKSHDLYVTVVDSLGYNKFFNFVYETNNDFPGIFLKILNNNSRVQGGSQITIEITNSNGSFIHNWDGNTNTTLINGVPSFIWPITISNLEGTFTLNIYAKSDKELWLHKRFVFVVDNTPPIFLIHNPSNKSVIKGTVDILIAVSEKSNVTYILNNDTHDSFIAETGLNYTITFSKLVNGSYQLNFTIFDEAKNPTNAIFFFEIYSSAFGWNWDLSANVPRTIDVVDASETTWFYLTLLSKTNQNFNLSVLPDDSTPSKTEKMLFIIQLSCDRLTDILFMTLNLPLDETDQPNTFDIYQWVHWDNSNNRWQEIMTSYNALSHSWEATYEGSIEFFALIKTGGTTELKSIEPGGGQIPAFTIFIVITSLITCSIILRKKKSM
ncbi:MAG: hypothetical protein ACFE95_05300 [Candidatus Hodarchaeota archaeon]